MVHVCLSDRTGVVGAVLPVPRAPDKLCIISKRPIYANNPLRALCFSSLFSRAFWGLLVAPVGHAVSLGVCPPSPVLVLSPTWEHKWQAAFKQACCTFEICPQDGFWCPVTALFLGGGMAVAIHNVVLDLQRRCEVFTALLLQDKLGSELEPALAGSCRGSWARGSCPWRWFGDEQLLLGWGSRGSGAEQLWCLVLASTPGKAQNLALPRTLPTEWG